MTLKAEFFRYLDHIGRSVPLRELAAQPQVRDVVALRHDIDHDLDLALETAHHEHARGLRATYFLLHTHAYWQDPQLTEKCAQLEAYGHEVGLHLNVLTQWMTADAPFDIDERLRRLLDPLRAAGISVEGTSAHGDRACYEPGRGFINYWIWKELRGDDPARAEAGRSAEGVRVEDARWQVPYPPDHRLRRPDGAALALWSSRLADHGLRYDAAHLPVDHYWSDTGGGWTRSGDPLAGDLGRGRHQVLMHPHWWRAPARTVFVLSAARSGSRWLANFVDRATSARGLHEWTLNHRRAGDEVVADKRTNDDFPALVDDPSAAARLIQDAVRHLRTLPGDTVEANVYLEAFLPQLRSIAPDASVLHLHRHGADVVRSIIQRGWYDTPDETRHRRAPIDHWDELTQFERACWYWRSVNENIMPCATARLAFERMTVDLPYLTRALEALGIVVHPRLAAAEFPKRINATEAHSFPAPADWPPPLERAFAEICGAVQSALGYETAAAPTPGRRRRRRGAGESATLLDLDGTATKSRDLSCRHVRAVPTDRGLVVSTEAPTRGDAHVVLARGNWRRVPRRHGLPCAHQMYYTCRLSAGLTAGMVVRLFVLFFEESGAQIRAFHATTVRDGPGSWTCSFAGAPGASHFAIALHLGRQSPEDVLTLESITVTATPMDADYRAVPPRPVGSLPGG